MCAVATALASRLAAVLREGRTYTICDVDGIPVDPTIARRIISERYTVPPDVRAARRVVTRAKLQKGRRSDGGRSKAEKPSPPVAAAPLDHAKRVLEHA